MKRLWWFAALLAALASPLQAATPPWPEAPYAFYAENQTVQQVVREFAAQFGLTASIADGVTGRVNGRIAADTPAGFLNRLGNAYGLTWFYYGGTLYIDRASEVLTRPIAAQGGSLASLKQALTALGLLDPRFGWGELPERGVALVSGPRAYVELIAKAVTDLPTLPADERVAVFRLKHASVEDRVMLFRDRQLTTPGVATILQNLIAGRDENAGSQSQLLDMAAPLRNATPIADVGGAAKTEQPRADRPGQQRVAAIQADPRINAVIVRDNPARIPVYAQLIEALDVPTELIEIEAMILDVNSSKLSELGIAWAGRDGRTAAGFGRVGEPDGNTLVFNRGSSVNPSTILADAGNYLVSRIKFLEGRGDARVLSRPSVLTVDNLGALLDLSETFYIRVSGERTANVVPITTGTTLRVTPRLVEHQGRHQIQLVVDIEDGAIQDKKLVGDLPTVRRSVVSTQAVIGENESLLIGGYHNEVDIKEDNHIPVLGQIPLLGALFSNKSSDRQKRERLFLITPKRVSSQPGLPARMLPPVPETPAPVERGPSPDH
ncbi:type III secretion system outer membrane ring subunit SctC [Chitinimonas lacunae]|uniref:Type 3 secretion system secretin n=1 Tax=Chitinimonas lacunae TaxID=1963018 RepID=A0ABV8MPD9_9NEIS